MDMKKGMHARTSRNRSHFPSSRSINLPFIKFRLSRVTFNFPLRGPVTSVPWSQWERKRFRLEAHRARRLNLVTIFFTISFPCRTHRCYSGRAQEEAKGVEECLSLSTQQQHDMAQLIAKKKLRIKNRIASGVIGEKRTKGNAIDLTLAIVMSWKVSSFLHLLRNVMTWTLISLGWYSSPLDDSRVPFVSQLSSRECIICNDLYIVQFVRLARGSSFVEMPLLISSDDISLEKQSHWKII